MRTLSSEAMAALTGRLVPIVLLVEMELTAPLYLCTSNLNLVVGGNTYYGLKGLGRIGAVSNTPAEVKQLSFEVSGVPSELVALALTEPVQGKDVRIKLALFNSSYVLLDAQTIWQGRLDVMNISDSPDGSTISVTAEHAGIDLTRPSSSYYSDDEQQRLHPGDLFFQFTSAQVEQRIVWPDKSFFKK